MHPITQEEKDLLRGLKHDCRVDHPHILPRIIDCVDYRNNLEVRELHSLLTKWPIISIQNNSILITARSNKGLKLSFYEHLLFITNSNEGHMTLQLVDTPLPSLICEK